MKKSNKENNVLESNKMVLEFLEFTGNTEIAEIFKSELDKNNENERNNTKESTICDDESQKEKTKNLILENILNGVPLDYESIFDTHFDFFFNPKLLNHLKRIVILEMINREEYDEAFLLLDNSDSTTREVKKGNLGVSPTFELIEHHKMTIPVDDLLCHIIFKTSPDLVKERETTVEIIKQFMMEMEDKKCTLLDAINRVGIDKVELQMKMKYKTE